MAQSGFEQLTQSELFQKVAEICAAVNTVTDSRELLELSLERTMTLFGAERGSIFIWDEKGKDLILQISRGLELSEQKSIVKKLGEGIVGRVAETKTPICVEDISKDERFRDHKAQSKYRTPSFICAPLLLKDKLIGVINISEKGADEHFSANELQLMDFLSSQIALNYRRIQLYRKFQDVIKESQTLKDELGRSSEETTHLKKQVIQHERLASIGKLAGGIAHEFNNPLDGVMRYTNLCLEHVNDEVVRGYLLEVKHGLNRMANIVKSLLACSRSTDVSPQRINPNAALETALQGLQTHIVHRGIKFECSLAEDLPEVVDLGLDRVWSNLIRNAIEAVEDKGSVKVRTRQDGGNVVLEVSDSGCGIEGGQVEQIFEPFHTTKDIDKGCGLGLTIVSEIVKGYSGSISVASDKNAGTTFTVALPIK